MAEKRPSGHRVEMSYNCWQIAHLVACSMLYSSIDEKESLRLEALLEELPARDFHKVTTFPPNPRTGRTRAPSKSFPKIHRQVFRGSVLVTLKKVLEEAAELKGGIFSNSVCQVHRVAQEIKVDIITQLGHLV